MKRAIWAATLAALVLPFGATAEVCTATALPVAYGSYNPQSVVPTDSSGQVTVACTGGLISIGVSYTIRLSSGAAGAFAPRQMVQGAGRLNYNLYSNSLRTAVWGNGSAGAGTVTDGYLLGLLTVTRNYTVYGRVPAQQNVAAGVYTDTIVVTVDY